MAISSSLAAEKTRWWLSNRKLVRRYLRDARSLVATRELPKVSTAVGLLDVALALSPRHEAALELKARSLLFLRRFREVADMLQDYIPSCKMQAAAAGDNDSSTSLGSVPLNRKLLSPGSEGSGGGLFFRCFSVSDLKRKFLAGLSQSSGDEGHWRYVYRRSPVSELTSPLRFVLGLRYLVLGHACCRLGLLEDAMVLLQAGRRLAAAASRRRSVCWPDDSFVSSTAASTGGGNGAAPMPTESESASQLLSHIKLLLRRTTAAVAALDAGVPAEASRLFSKVLDGRRGVPAAFAAGCFVGRACAHRAAGRLAEAIADCNRALAVEPFCVPALRARADLLEAVGALPDCLSDLDHLKLLYDSILRDGKLPGPPWRPHHGVRYRDIPVEHRALTARIQQVRCQVAAAGGCIDVDYHALIGVRHGCTRSELERAYLLLSLRHKPEKATAFVARLEFADDHRDPDGVRDQAKMSAMVLYRMLQKGYSRIMATVMNEEKVAVAVAAAAQVAASIPTVAGGGSEVPKKAAVAAAGVFQRRFCRDTAEVGSMHCPGAIPVK
ncbi:hypothetical protein BHE74_00045047 [Ensete ventricosum]|nr:hypothetical protein GW17_00023095 [Ensete ventricosum]RWW48852.1 hypothetical protein BHE74_00045047 [Ensete ventricosum]